MGIDVYMHWKGKTAEDKQAQITGFSATSGDVGYLREAYHGGPYVTHYLCAEAFNDDEQPEGYKGEPIPAETLRKRLPKAVALAMVREAKVYGKGSNPGVIEIPDNENLDDSASILKLCTSAMAEGSRVGQTQGESELVALEHLPARWQDVVEQAIKNRKLPETALAFVDFVELAERKEAETGEAVLVYASY